MGLGGIEPFDLVYVVNRRTAVDRLAAYFQVLEAFNGCVLAYSVSEFQGVVLPLSSEGSRDVKYHFGQRGTFRTAGGRDIEARAVESAKNLESRQEA